MIGMDFGDGLGYGRTWDDGSPVGIHREAVRILGESTIDALTPGYALPEAQYGEGSRCSQVPDEALRGMGMRGEVSCPEALTAGLR